MPEGFPVGSDLVEFTTRGEKIGLYCLMCGEDLPNDVNYLNEAVLEWRKHREKFQGKEHRKS